MKTGDIPTVQALAPEEEEILRHAIGRLEKILIAVPEPLDTGPVLIEIETAAKGGIETLRQAAISSLQRRTSWRRIGGMAAMCGAFWICGTLWALQKNPVDPLGINVIKVAAWGVFSFLVSLLLTQRRQHIKEIAGIIKK